MTTQDLDEVAEEYIRAQGGVPTFKGYRGFPASICTSPNSMVVHGIPGSYRIDDGDLLSVDVGVTLDGYVADSAYTFAVGEVPESSQRLLEAGQAALEAGIEQARAGNRIGDISAAIQRTTEDAGFAVVRELVGHGVGRSMHEEPQIPNFGEPGRGPLLQPGMTLAIEPMITAGPGRRLHRRRPLVDLHARRLARRALRAHGRGDRRKPPHPDRRGRPRLRRVLDAFWYD